MKVTFKRLHPYAQLPVRATDGAAGYDVRSVERLTLQPGDHAVVATGLAAQIPAGTVLYAFSRSGHGFTYGVRLRNCVGVIDSDYRGELKVALKNDGDRPLNIEVGDRIAQVVLMPFYTIEASFGELDNTERGGGGFGSTGV